MSIFLKRPNITVIGDHHFIWSCVASYKFVSKALIDLNKKPNDLIKQKIYQNLSVIIYVSTEQMRNKLFHLIKFLNSLKNLIL